MGDLLKINRSAILLILFLVGFLIYAPALKAPFFWDDYTAIPEIQPYQGIEHTESRPLRVFSFYIDSFLWKGNPAGYHFTNILLNALAGCLVFLFLNMILENSIYSFIISLIFILHPIHTETVIWIKNRTEILFLIFFILSFLSYKKNLILSVAMFALCALSKETSVIFPVILTLYIYLFDKEKKYTSVIPFYIIAFIRGAYGLIYAREIVGAGGIGSLFSHINLILNTFGFYLGKLLFPVKLLVDWQPQISFSLIPLLMFLFFIIIMFLPKIDKNIRFFLMLLFISILPYSNVIFIAGRPLGEQRMFLPSLAFAAIFFFLIVSVIKWKILKYAIFSALIIFYAGRTYLRAKEWQDPILLWKQAERFYPSSARIKHNLGGIYYEQGDYQQAKKYYLQALGTSVDEYGYYLSAQNLALISMKEKDFEATEKILKGILKARPKDGSALYNIGLVCIKMDKYDDAIIYLERVKKILPKAIQIYNNLAVSYMRIGKPDKAAKVLKEAITIDPKYSNGMYNLIVIYKKSGRKQEALNETEEALKIFPNNAVFLKLYQELKV